MCSVLCVGSVRCVGMSEYVHVWGGCICSCCVHVEVWVCARMQVFR